MIKTFRGKLADGGQDRIRLSTKKGKIGYKVISLEVFPGASFQDQESQITIFKVKQTSVATASPTIDLSDGNVLAVAMWKSAATGSAGAFTHHIMFEQEVFNQDIYITHTDHSGTQTLNYYLELETMNMTDNAAAVSTLRDIRLNPQKHA